MKPESNTKKVTIIILALLFVCFCALTIVGGFFTWQIFSCTKVRIDGRNGDGYGKDCQKIYYIRHDSTFGFDHYDELPGADYATFEFIKDTEYAKDKNQVYYLNKLVHGADASTFTGFSNQAAFGKDKNYLYAYGEKKEKIDLNSFQIINTKYSKDKNTVYYNLSALPGSNPQTWKVDESSGYSMDDKFVWYGGNLLESSDPTSFQVLYNPKDNRYAYSVKDQYSKDKNQVYYSGDILKLANPKTFEYLGLSYSRDDKRAWYEDTELKVANPLLFEEKSNLRENIFEGSSIALWSDGTYYYKLGKEVDPENVMTVDELKKKLGKDIEE